MIAPTLCTVLLMTLMASGNIYKECKSPTVTPRPLAPDVINASPFYVVALPKTSSTEKIDNVCYTYFKLKGDRFFNVISVTNKDGSNKYYTYTKGDIPGWVGVAEADSIGRTDFCIFRDYTLTPICSNTVFDLYRCFRNGNCRDIDAPSTTGKDVHVFLSTTRSVMPDCQQQIMNAVSNTPELDGGQEIILPQILPAGCVTEFNGLYSIGHDKALGCRAVTDPSTPYGSVSFIFESSLEALKSGEVFGYSNKVVPCK